ncbi:hypothetical protein POBR111598_09960 [Polynucleobacter brandtiae]
MAVVPVIAFCIRLVAATELLKVVLPVLVKEILPRPCEPPTAPVKVMLPVPAETVRFFVVVAALLRLEANTTLLLVVVKVALAAKFTAPV